MNTFYFFKKREIIVPNEDISLSKESHKLPCEGLVEQPDLWSLLKSRLWALWFSGTILFQRRRVNQRQLCLWNLIKWHCFNNRALRLLGKKWSKRWWVGQLFVIAFQTRRGLELIHKCTRQLLLGEETIGHWSLAVLELWEMKTQGLSKYWRIFLKNGPSN